MILLVIKETKVGLRKNLNPKIKGLNPDLSLELGTANIVVPITNVDIVLHTGKHAKVVERRIILQNGAGLIKAKARLMAQGVLSNHLNTEKSMQTRSLVMMAK